MKYLHKDNDGEYISGVRNYARHVFVIVNIIIFVGGVFNLFGSGDVVIAWPDSFGYLGPVADYQESGQFTHWFGRQFIYPAFLWLILQISSDPLAILYAQKILLAVTYFLALLVTHILIDNYRQIAGKISSSRELITDVMVHVLASLILAMFIFYGPLIALAHTIMTETLFTFILMTIIFLITLQSRYLSNKDRLAIHSLIILLGICLTLVKPHFIFAGVFLVLFVYWINRANKLAARGFVLVAVCVAVTSYGYENYLQRKYDHNISTTFGAKSLFCNNADLVYKYFATQANPDTNIVNELRTQLEAGPVGGWNLQGFDGDKCTYGKIAGYVSEMNSSNPEDEKDYYINTYLKAAILDPLHIVNRVYKQMLALLKRPLTPDYRQISGDCNQVLSFEKDKVMFAEWAGRCDRFTGDTSFQSVPPSAIKYYNSMFLPLLILAVMVLIYESTLKNTPIANKLKCQQRDDFICLIGIFLLINLLISLVHTLDVFRYYVMQTPLIFVLFLSSIVHVFSLIKKPEIKIAD